VLMQVDHGEDARANTPRLYLHKPSRWPMTHLDTGEIIKLPSDHGITTDFKEHTLSGSFEVARVLTGSRYKSGEITQTCCYVQNGVGTGTDTLRSRMRCTRRRLTRFS
jgi:hypothetical protein